MLRRPLPDAVDTALTTTFGPSVLTKFVVHTEEVARPEPVPVG